MKQLFFILAVLPFFCFQQENKETPDILPIKSVEYSHVASGFGKRMHPIQKRWKMHTGIDFTAEIGTGVHVTMDGVVEVADSSANNGNYIIVKHKNGFKTHYRHLHKLLVTKKQVVKKDEIIAEVGSTGRSSAPHLHYEIELNGEKVNPEDYFSSNFIIDRYKGGLGSSIYAFFNFYNDSTYTYKEVTHTGYSVNDIGNYKFKNDSILILNSDNTIHSFSGVSNKSKKRIISKKYEKLFIEAECKFITYDTLLIDRKRILLNKDIDIYLKR